MPAGQDDRLVGAIIAGLPTQAAPAPHGDFVSTTANDIEDPWTYGEAANVIERGHGTFQVGQQASPLNAGLSRSQHAHAVAVPAELSAGARNQ